MITCPYCSKEIGIPLTFKDEIEIRMNHFYNKECNARSTINTQLHSKERNQD